MGKCCSCHSAGIVFGPHGQTQLKTGLQECCFGSLFCLLPPQNSLQAGFGLLPQESLKGWVTCNRLLSCRNYRDHPAATTVTAATTVVTGTALAADTTHTLMGCR